MNGLVPPQQFDFRPTSQVTLRSSSTIALDRQSKRASNLDSPPQTW